MRFSSTPWSVDYGRITPLIVKAVQDIAGISSTFKANLIAWLASAGNGIRDLYAGIVHSQEDDTQKLCVQKSDGSDFCVSGDQLAAMAAGAPAYGGGPGAPSGQPAQGGSASSNSTTTSSDNAPPTIIINGNSPAQWPLNQIWNDNLGALFTHAGQSETIYSTTTVDTTLPGSHTIVYVVSDSSGLTSTTTRTVIVSVPANDNQASSTPTAANDNLPLPLMAATGTDPTTTAQ
jgi:surface protein with Ig-like domain